MRKCYGLLGDVKWAVRMERAPFLCSSLVSNGTKRERDLLTMLKYSTTK
jgi:hypothetical protein